MNKKGLNSVYKDVQFIKATLLKDYRGGGVKARGPVTNCLLFRERVTQIWERSGLQYTEQGGLPLILAESRKRGIQLTVVRVLYSSEKKDTVWTYVFIFLCRIKAIFDINIRLGLSNLVQTHTHTQTRSKIRLVDSVCSCGTLLYWLRR